jgi:uncharacterized protein (TIGR02147 family)
MSILKIEFLKKNVYKDLNKRERGGLMEPVVSEYLNYRDYLKDFYNAKKSLKKEYSYRVFTNKAQVGSPSHLKMIIDGERNLTHKTIPKYVKALGFKNKKEIRFFELLVKYNQCKEQDTKIQLFEDLLKEKKKKGLTAVEMNQLSFLSQWYYVAIYVMVDLPEFISDALWIQSRLVEKVPLTQIRQALKDLEALKLIKTVGDSYQQTGGALSVPDEIQDLAIPRYHATMNDLARKSLEKTARDLREFNGATIAIKKENLPNLKKMVRAFRKEINELTSNTEGADMIYQLNIQLFPLTKESK